MGCSRPGSVAVGSAVLSAALYFIALVLPYWSTAVMRAKLGKHYVELIFGLWATCIHNQKGSWASFLSTNTNNYDGVNVDDDANAASFTCASYFSNDVVSIQCNSVRDFINDRCTRTAFSLRGGLCAASNPVSALGEHLDSDAAMAWGAFLSRSCNGFGQTGIGLSVITAGTMGLAFVLLVVGISCGPIDSVLVKYGAITTMCTCALQFILFLMWIIDAASATHGHFTLASSFYLLIVSALFSVITVVAARKHRNLEKEAMYEAMHGEDDDDVSKGTGNSIKTGEVELVAV